MSSGAGTMSSGCGSSARPLLASQLQQRELARQNAQLRRDVRALHEAVQQHRAEAEAALRHDHDDPLEQLLLDENNVRRQLSAETALQAELLREAKLLGGEVAALDEEIKAERLMRGALLRVLTNNQKGGKARDNKEEGPADEQQKAGRGAVTNQRAAAEHRLEEARRAAQTALSRHQQLQRELLLAQRGQS
jgi:outer membrane murein-binding lipoprotein Lpp